MMGLSVTMWNINTTNLVPCPLLSPQKLHDAFFKHQTKPKLTSVGDIYYEGKEYEARVENLKPGQLSERLKEALGMGENTPPPWLINMQRYGPPPSYPDLKVPGLNAPIPPGGALGRGSRERLTRSGLLLAACAIL